MKKVTVISYTTLYRKGGAKFKRVAETMRNELPSEHLICRSIESKKDLKAIFHEVSSAGDQIEAFHFIGHSGMYGPMYGTVEYPEQFSPFEWKQLQIPFSENAKAYFHCCRSARWFANFFANVFKVETFGYHWYTTFSAKKDRFKLDRSETGPLYSIGCKGKKSHGYIGSIKKYLGAEAETMKSFKPEGDIDTTYDKVAELYNNVFQDIKVRQDEWNWFDAKIPSDSKQILVDIGCGNGALLNELSSRIGKGIGLDLSGAILKQAEKLNAQNSHISFKQLSGPQLPLEDNSVDIITSMLSFRYLDWDPLMEEIKRVLKPNGRFLIVDMVAVPMKTTEIPSFISSKYKHFKHRKRYPEYNLALKKLVNNPNWKHMLKYNPIRSEHEMKWYLESRFPNRKVEKINVGYHSSILAFDSGSFDNIKTLELSYP